MRIIQKCLFNFCSGPEITDELVKVLRKRLDETTLDIITVMLVRNCKLTPADVEVNDSFFIEAKCLQCLFLCICGWSAVLCTWTCLVQWVNCLHFHNYGFYSHRGKQKTLCTHTIENCFTQKLSPNVVLSVHPAIRISSHRGNELQTPPVLSSLAARCGSLPQAEPPHLPAYTQVHRQQHSTPLQGTVLTRYGQNMEHKVLSVMWMWYDNVPFWKRK